MKTTRAWNSHYPLTDGEKIAFGSELLQLRNKLMRKYERKARERDEIEAAREAAERKKARTKARRDTRQMKEQNTL